MSTDVFLFSFDNLTACEQALPLALAVNKSPEDSLFHMPARQSLKREKEGL